MIKYDEIVNKRWGDIPTQIQAELLSVAYVDNDMLDTKTGECTIDFHYDFKDEQEQLSIGAVKKGEYDNTKYIINDDDIVYNSIHGKY